ncbi:P-loop NTPase fold protein [Arthrobacter gyeryongensis]|uniref:P-loop NTPase fold protein n=1 Tax=Arthrobacter gyeryongensis TaxID=1650592 RepID=A0ABP9SC27_9MICC
MEPTQLPEHHKVADLHPLTPGYQPEKHAVYFDAIENALGWTGEKAVRNIALTGSYGVGKSSILRRVAEDPDRKVIQVSLSTLGFGTESAATKAAATPSQEVDQAANPLRETKTNQIQKEIVKQLLYTQTPEKMPGSRYRRTSTFSPKREALFSLAAGVPVALTFFLLGWTSKLTALFTVPADLAITANIGMALVCAAFVLAVRYATHNKIRIDKVSAGAATITLSAASDTYFDEYLDEIVYFFEVVDADIVIFEDIDRFEDAHIFETLRALNTILNAAKQLDGRVIRFLYAIKDSIFEELGTRAAREAAARPDASHDPAFDAATLEVARANRTKFFDLVIPVVPFVTHQSARELMVAELRDLKHSISDDLIDLVAQRVADMRLIKNIRNEFVIFQQQVIKKSSLKLDDDRLFAMVLYKSTHLSDFERIKLGTSNLDTLYRESRQLVQEHTARLNAEVAVLRRRLRYVNDQSARSEKVGDAVRAYIALVLGHTGFSFNDIRYDGTPIPLDDMRTKGFWQKYAAGTADLSFTYHNPYRGVAQVSGLTREELERATGDSLDPSNWEFSARAEIDAEITAARRDIAFLSKADVSDLIGRPDLKMKRYAGAAVSFAERAASLLGSKLAVELVTQGFIDRYFTLYTSTFVGERVNANAMNFILKNVDTGSIDFYFPLSPEEAKAVLHERPRLAVREKSSYNFDFVDYLLNNDEASAETVLTNLRRNGDDEKQFLEAYLSSERDIVLLVGGLVRGWSDVLIVLAGDLELADEQRLLAVDGALSGLADGIDYSVSDDLTRYLQDNHTALKSFSQLQEASRAKRLAKVVNAADFLVPDLAPLSDSVRQAIIDVERFEVTRDNLLMAIAPSGDLSLNALQKTSKHVYQRIISDLGPYFALLTHDEQTVTDPDAFVSIIEGVDQVDRGSLSTVVGRAVDECCLPHLNGVAPGTWPALASHARFPSEFGNVAAYIEQYGIDGNLAVVLAAGTIAVDDDVEEAEKLELASELLNSAEHLPSAALRASLLESLHLENFLPASSVPTEPGEWVGRLVENRIIDDDAASFALIATDDWQGLEYAIRASRSIASFISPEILAPSDMTRFLASSKVPETLKRSVVERFAEFAVGADRDALQALTAYAVRYNARITWADVKQAACAHVDHSLTLNLMQRFLSGASLDHLTPVLEALGGDYPTLGAPNGRRRRFPNTGANRALLERLRELGTVHRIIPDGTDLKVNMKRQ